MIAIQPQRWDSTLAIAIFISGGHSTKAFMRSWKMPSRAAFDIDILVMAAPEYLDIVSRGRWPAVLPSFVESVAGSRDLKRSTQIEFFLKGFARPPQRSRSRPDSAGNVKKADLLRMRAVERMNRLGGWLQQDRAALFRKIRLSFRR